MIVVGRSEAAAAWRGVLPGLFAVRRHGGFVMRARDWWIDERPAPGSRRTWSRSWIRRALKPALRGLPRPSPRQIRRWVGGRRRSPRGAALRELEVKLNHRLAEASAAARSVFARTCSSRLEFGRIAPIEEADEREMRCSGGGSLHT